MFSSRFSSLRFIEKISLLLAAGLAGLTVYAYVNQVDVRIEIAVAVGVVLFFALLSYVITAKQVSKRISILATQSEFANDTQYLLLFERSPVPYITINKKGIIISINQAGVKLLHSTIESLLKSNFLDRLVASDKSDVSIIASKVKAGMTINDVELALRSDDHDNIWVLFSSYTNKQTGQSMISLVNITQAKKVDEAKTEFVALATHQLRTPIAAIRWNTELLQKQIPENLKDNTNRYFTKINRNVYRMTALINDFLNVSKLELGTFSTESKTINLKELVDSAVDEFTDRFEQKFIKLERSELPPEFSFVTDERLFQIIVSNLLSNAVKYVKESGTIWLTTQVNDNMLILQVADNGIGIPVKEIDSLFTKFYRATNAEAQQTQGTGLGLYIVKQAVEQLGGSISVISDFDKGAVFNVSLPLTGTHVA